MQKFSDHENTASNFHKHVKQAPATQQPALISFNWLDSVVFESKETRSPIVLRGQLQLDVHGFFQISRFSISLRGMLQNHHWISERTGYPAFQLLSM